MDHTYKRERYPVDANEGREAELRALQKARVDLMIEQKFRAHHDRKAAEALAEIQRLRRKLGV